MCKNSKLLERNSSFLQGIVPSLTRTKALYRLAIEKSLQFNLTQSVVVKVEFL